MKNLALAAIWGCCLLPRVAFCQSDAAIRGAISAQADHSLLPNADVEISNSTVKGQHTTSDNEGQFSFPRVIPGNYTLRVSRDGFQQRQLEIVLKPREVQNLTIELVVQGITQSVEVQGQGETYSPHSTTLQ